MDAITIFHGSPCAKIIIHRFYLDELHPEAMRVIFPDSPIFQRKEEENIVPFLLRM